MPFEEIEPLKAIQLEQYGMQIYLTKFNMELLNELSQRNYLRVEKYQVGDEDTYQRDENKGRVRELASFLIDYRNNDLVKPILPSSIVLNAPDSSDIAYEDGYIKIKRGARLNIVDGQHRWRGLLAAYAKENSMRYEVPVSIVTNLERFQEAAQFLVINVKQKPVRTDLTLTVLYELQQKYTMDFVERLKGALDVDAWKLDATAATIALNDGRTSPWHNLIIRPNEDRQHLRSIGRSFTPVRQAGFVDSLRKFSEQKLPDVNSKIEFLKMLWNNLKNKYPDAFDPETGKNYVLLRGPAVGAIHALAPLLYSLNKEGILSVEDAISEFHHYYPPRFWDKRNGKGREWASSQKEYSTNAVGIAKKIVPELYDIFNKREFKRLGGEEEELDQEEYEEFHSALDLFNPFNLKAKTYLSMEGTDQTGCYLLISGTKDRPRAYVGQSIHIRERLEEHSRRIKLYSFIVIPQEKLDRFEALSYHLTKSEYLINDDHPPLHDCPYCDP